MAGPALLAAGAVHDLGLLGRVALAALLGGLLGGERDLRGHPAGLRTFSLVSLGTAAVTAVAIDALYVETGRIIAGLATGIGFLGAGLVIRSGNRVRNLTTAAATWVANGVGILCGAGRFVLATGLAVLTLLILELGYIPGLRLLDTSRYRPRFHASEHREHAEPDGT